MSVLLVVMGHWINTHTEPGWVAWRPLVGGLVQLGVSVFFVISGFLITRLLMDERARTGRISLRQFYVRRALRILPPAFAYLGTLAALTALGFLSIPWRNFWLGAAFSADYWPIGDWLGHFWSLSVEEKFYLAWPALLIWAGFRRSRSIALGVILAAPVLRVLTYFFAYSSLQNMGMFHMRMDTLMWGCLLAISWDSVRTRATARLLAQCALGSAFIVLVVEPYCRARFGGSYLLPLGYTLQGLSIALVIAWAVLRPETFVARPLNAGILPWFGVFSYSLYLWQEPFLIVDNHSWLGRPPWNLGFAIMAGWLGYMLIEKPSGRLRQRIAARANVRLVARAAAGTSA